MAGKKGSITDLIAPRVALREVGGDALNHAIDESLAEVGKVFSFVRKNLPRGLYRQDRDGIDMVYKVELYLSRPQEIIETLQRRIDSYARQREGLKPTDSLAKVVEHDGLEEKLDLTQRMLSGFLKQGVYETDSGLYRPCLRAVTVGPFSPLGPLGVSLTVECRRADTEAYLLGTVIAKGLLRRLPTLTIVLQEEELEMHLDDVVIYAEGNATP